MHNDMYEQLTTAKPAQYQGVWYASRQEAKWALILSTLDIPFYHQPSTYKLPSGYYLPDFWVPSMNAYLEVKPWDVTDQRYGELGEMSSKRIFVVSGDLPHIPAVWSEETVYPVLRGRIWLKWPHDGPSLLTYMLARERQGRFNIVPIAHKSSASGIDPAIMDAYIAASTYPFER